MLRAPARPCDPGVIAGVAPGSDCAERAKPFVLAATIAASAMAFIDASVMDIVLPVIGTDFAAPVGALQWVVNAYVLVNAALALIGGSAGDRFGRRRLFIVGIAIFTLGSIGCGFAPGIDALIAARVIQGFGCALMVPNSLAIVGATFAESERGRAIGTWAGATAMAGVIAPTFGGWIADAVSWRAIFFINVPIALFTLLLTVRSMPESRVAVAPARLDWAGAGLASCGLGALTFGLIEAGDLGWSHPVVIGAVIAGLVLVVAFLAVEARSVAPMMPLGLFRSRAFSGVNLMTLLLYAALGGAFFFIPFELIRIEKYSAAEAGAAFLPFPLIMAVLSRWSGGLFDRFGARLPLIVGPAITAVGFALLARVDVGFSYWSAFFPAMVILGLGMAITVAPLTTAVMNAVPDTHIGIASAINNSATDTSSLLAVAVFGVVGRAVFATTLDANLASMSPSPELSAVVQAIKATLAGAPIPVDFPEAQRMVLVAAVDRSFLAGFRLAMLGAAGLSLIAAIAAAFTIGTAGGSVRTPKAGLAR